MRRVWARSGESIGSLAFDCLWIYGVLLALFSLLDLDRAVAGLNTAIVKSAFALADVTIESMWKDGALWLAPSGGHPVALPALLVNPFLPLYLAVVTALARSRRSGFVMLVIGGALVTIAFESVTLAAAICAYDEGQLPDSLLVDVLAALPEEPLRALSAVPVFVGAILARSLPTAAREPATRDAARDSTERSDGS